MVVLLVFVVFSTTRARDIYGASRYTVLMLLLLHGVILLAGSMDASVYLVLLLVSGLGVGS